jgi:hypothetical protein
VHIDFSLKSPADLLISHRIVSPVSYLPHASVHQGRIHSLPHFGGGFLALAGSVALRSLQALLAGDAVMIE